MANKPAINQARLQANITGSCDQIRDLNNIISNAKDNPDLVKEIQDSIEKEKIDVNSLSEEMKMTTETFLSNAGFENNIIIDFMKNVAFVNTQHQLKFAAGIEGFYHGKYDIPDISFKYDEETDATTEVKLTTPFSMLMNPMTLIASPSGPSRGL